MRLPWQTSASKPSKEYTDPIFIDDMGMHNRVTKLLDKKQKIGREIDLIQSSCNHKDKVIRLVQRDERYCSFEERWVCNDCSKTLSYPTAFEKERFSSKNS